MSEGTASQVTRGAVWMLAARIVDAGMGMVSMIILARLLAPEDFGLLALGSSLVGMLQLLRAFSFDMVLIHRQNADRSEYDTAWTINLILSSGIALALAAASVPLARGYDDDRLVAVVWVIALAKFIEGFENVGIVDFRKNLQFKREFLLTLLRRVGGFAITLILAFSYRDYWALVIGMAAGQVLSVALSFLLHPFRPRPTLVAWRELISFSQWNAINAVAHAVSVRSGDFMIGKLAGLGGLGLFTIANDIAFIPSSELGAPINRAVYPGYAKVAQDPQRLRAAFYQVVSIIALVVVPISVGMMATAESFMPIAVDKRWWPAIPLIVPLALRGLLHGLVSNVPYVYLAMGKPELGTVALVARAVILLPVLWLGLEHSGVVGAAWAFAVSMVFEIPIHLWLLHRELGVRMLPVLARILRPTLAAAAMSLAVRAISHAWLAPAATWPALARLVSIVGVGAMVYGIALFAIWFSSRRPAGGERILLEHLNALWKARREGIRPVA